MTLNLIWSQTSAGVLGGATGAAPWTLPEDVEHVRRLTAGCPVLLSRAAWDALPGPLRPLPDPDTIVLTRDRAWSAAGVTVVADVDAALTATAGRRTWVLGAGRDHPELLALADRVEITEVDLDVPGDVVAPVLGHRVWSSVTQAWRVSSSGVQYRFASYLRAA
ncbi:dihydrofolate reductase [uncultured Cellulomonas sp.]|uniref:dihydrofolate reductase n=1 Tax=uncultured Cellulomonas sp. TaxID=189682 RepID=UPI00263640F5|nr:dihydrofolate reductase [uncultured Cellulomonas sp.]